jgi:hypothetical protein
MPYAKGTKVPTAKSEFEIKYLLKRMGAEQVGTFEDGLHHRAIVVFRLDGLSIALPVPLPDPDDPGFLLTPSKKVKRTPEKAFEEYEHEVLRRWRVLLMLIKAKLETIELGMSTIQREFLPDVMLPGGGTVESWLGPSIEGKYLECGAPDLTPALPSGGADA